MKKTTILRLLSVALCVVLIAAMALCITACNDNTTNSVSSGVTDTSGGTAEVKKLGQGDTQFEFSVTHKDGTQVLFEISTNETTVGAALLNTGVIAGDVEDYGLYVKTVDGETLDFNTDGMYWAFYINGEYAMSGVDTTNIIAGDSYSFKAEK